MSQKTDWGFLNYTRSRDVQDRQERNLNACLRAAQAYRAWKRSGDSFRGPAAQYVALDKAIPSRDSAMQ